MRYITRAFQLQMIIHIIGDSHVNSFKGWKVKRHYLGAVTLKRVGVDKELFNFIKRHWECWFCFGEIDVRCHIKPVTELFRKKSFEQIISHWIDLYIEAIERVDCKKKGIVSITPPSPIGRADTKAYPVRGTDEERIIWTQWINKYLEEVCSYKNWQFINTYKNHQVNGILPLELSDGTVHIKKIKGTKMDYMDELKENYNWVDKNIVRWVKWTIFVLSLAAISMVIFGYV